jgi:RNA polymerase sigma factor (sigma-70 family)
MPLQAGQQVPERRATVVALRPQRCLDRGRFPLAPAAPPVITDVSVLMDQFARTGDERAFEQIVTRYSGMVHAVCSQVTHNAHDAEDATQAVFLTLALELRGVGRGGGTPIRSPGAWLQQVAHRVSLDLYKSRKRRIAREDRCRQMKLADNHAFSRAADDSIDEEELKRLLRDELNQLPTRYRTPMILYYFGGMTPVSIARQLGCRPKALGMRLFRGRKMLAEQLASRGLPVGAAALAVALASAIQCGVTDALAGASTAAGSGAGAGASFGFNVTNGFNAGPAFGPSLGVGNGTRDLAPMFVRIMRTVAGSGIKLSGRAKIAMALALLIASGVGGSSQLVRDVVSAAGSNWIAPLTTHVGQQFQRLWRSLPNALPRPRISVSAAPATSPPAASAQQANAVHSTPVAVPLNTTATSSPLQTGYAIAAGPYVPARIDLPSAAPQQSRGAMIPTYANTSFVRSIASNIGATGDPFRLPSRDQSATAQSVSSSGMSGAASSGHRGHDEADDPVANHAIAAINRWMLAAETRHSGGDDGVDGTGMGMFEKNEQLASRDDIPQLTAEQWIDRLLRMAGRDERFSVVDPQTLVDLAQRAAEDSWDYRVLTVDRLAIALGLNAPDSTGNDRNNVLSMNHPITPVPEPGTVFLLGATAMAGIMLRRRRRQS